MLENLQKIAEVINKKIGQIMIWLSFFIVIVTCIVVVMRYGFNTGSIPIQESIIYMNACLFMLCMGYALQNEEHVRIDVFYRKLSARKKAIINILGFCFALLPMCVCIIYFSFEYVLNSWIFLEASMEAGGLPFVFLLKTLILIMPVLLLIQGISHLIKDCLILKQKHYG